MAINDWCECIEDFRGPQTLLTTAPAGADQWRVAVTAAAGTPTHTIGGTNGEATLAFDNTNEVQNLCLYQNDVLNWNIDLIDSVELWVKLGQASLDSTTQFAIGLSSARNDTIDSLSEAALFRVVGSDDGEAVVCETDDGTNNNDDVATVTNLREWYKKLVISFALGKDDVRFLIDNHPVATGTTFDMSNYSGNLQVMMQIQKTADTNTDSAVLDYVRVVSRRR